MKKYDKAKVSSTKLRAIKREVAIMLFLARKRYVTDKEWTVFPRCSTIHRLIDLAGSQM